MWTRCEGAIEVRGLVASLSEELCTTSGERASDVSSAWSEAHGGAM